MNISDPGVEENTIRASMIPNLTERLQFLGDNANTDATHELFVGYLIFLWEKEILIIDPALNDNIDPALNDK